MTPNFSKSQVSLLDMLSRLLSHPASVTEILRLLLQTLPQSVLFLSVCDVLFVLQATCTSDWTGLSEGKRGSLLSTTSPKTRRRLSSSSAQELEVKG